LAPRSDVRVVAAFLMLAIVLSGCASEAPERSREPVTTTTSETSVESTRPSLSLAGEPWLAGYTFELSRELEAKIKLRYEESGGSMTDAQEYKDSARMSIEVLSTAFTHEGDPVALFAFTVDGATDDVLGEAPLLAGRSIGAVRQRDLQFMEVYVRYPPCSTNCRPERVSFVDLEGHYEWLRLPLKDGERWEGQSAMGGDYGFLQVQSTADVASAGKGLAKHVVRSTPDVSELEAALRASGFREAKATATLHGNRTVEYAVASRSYTKDTFDASEKVVVDVRSPSDTPGKFTLDLKLRDDIKLAKATYDAREEPGVEAVLDGLTLPTAPIPVMSITADRFDLNAATQDSVVLSVKTKHPLPPGDAIALSLEGPGPVSVSPVAGGLKAQFEEPGLYTATATAIRQGAAIAETRLDLGVRYEADVNVTCAAVAVQSCGSVALPVRAGISSIHVQATSSGVAADLAKLAVADPAGKRAESSFSGKQATLDVSTADFAVDLNDWALEYRPTVALGDTVTMHVLLSPEALPVQGEGLLLRLSAPFLTSARLAAL
jgi:hypothetical protein